MLKLEDEVIFQNKAYILVQHTNSLMKLQKKRVGHQVDEKIQGYVFYMLCKKYNKNIKIDFVKRKNRKIPMWIKIFKILGNSIFQYKFYNHKKHNLQGKNTLDGFKKKKKK